MTIRKRESQPALSTMLAVMGAKRPPDEMPSSDVRRIGRSNSLPRSIEDDESIERALAELAAVPVANDAPKAVFVVRARNEPSTITKERADRRPAARPKHFPKPTMSGSLGIASFIAADASPPKWLVDGLQENLERLLAGLHPKKRLSTEVRAEMGRAEQAAKTLQDLLRDTELLSHLSPDNLPNRNQFFAGLNWIAKRAAIAAAPGKRGRPKTMFDLSSLQFQCAVIVGVAWRMLWQEPLGDGDVDGQQACEMIWQALDRPPHQPSSTRSRRSRQDGVIVLSSFDTWGEWMEKVRKALEAPQEDGLNVKFAREVERTFRRAGAKR
jgi:hypothetical protein